MQPSVQIRDETPEAELRDNAPFPGEITAPTGGANLGGGAAFIGPYRLERALGRGGMGLVFLAHRADQQYEKRVAIKILSGVAGEHTLSRFRSERQILAKLDHPHIARMLDGGVTSDGEPYFVMDYIAGAEAIDDYCDQHKLALRARIQLFLTVCDAVQYAHRFLVVHRDLKPSNVQVSRDGIAKLVDFGIAKDLLSSVDGDINRLSNSSAAEPEIGDARTMTVGYASPEQVCGQAIGTASDIYALGVLLYELLAGTSPYLAASTDSESLMREVAAGEFVPPSKCHIRRGRPASDHVLAARGLTNQRQLERLLTGDLDAILRRAMARNPQDRYASASQFADDLRRYLSGDLVLAADHNRAYRLSKLVARHRAISSAVMITLLSSLFAAGLGGGLALKFYLDFIETRVAQQQAFETARFLASIYQGPPGASSKQVLVGAAAKLGSFQPGEPAWKESARLSVGGAMVDAGLFTEAASLLERVVTQNERAFNYANPDRVRAMVLLGEAWLGAEQPKLGAQWFRRAYDSLQLLEAPPPYLPRAEVLERKVAEALSR